MTGQAFKIINLRNIYKMWFDKLTYVIVVTSSLMVGETTSFVCKPHNKTDDLSFINPTTGRPSSSYPISGAHGHYNMAKEMSCCATGFNRISWTINGSIPGPTAEFYQDGQRIFINKVEVGTTTFKCTVYGDDGEMIEHTTKLYVTQYELPPTPPMLHFTKLAPHQCAEPGDNVTMHCQLQLHKDDKTFPPVRRILFERAGYMSYLDDPNYEWNVNYNRTTNLLDGYGTFTNITEDQLDANYTCQYLPVESVQHTFTLTQGPCGPEVRSVIEPFNDESGLVVGLAILGYLLVLIIGATLLFIFQAEARIWWTKKVLASCSKLGTSQHDIFMIYADSDEPNTLNIINNLDHQFKICLPDRDFEYGAVVPQETISKLKTSQYIIIILNNKIFDPDSWVDAQIKMALNIRQPVIFIRTETLQLEEVNKRRFLRAGMKVCTTLDYKSADHKSEFFKILYGFLPSTSARIKKQAVEHSDVDDREIHADDIKLDMV